MAQPLRLQIVVLAILLTAVVYAAIFYARQLTYDEHLRQLAAETSTMAATVAVYVNRNLEAADAVAVIASQHPSMQRLDPLAATEVLLPLVGGRDRLLGNALMADPSGRPLAWARPPDPAVEGKLDENFLRQVAERRQPLVSRLLGGPGDPAHAIVLGYPITAAGEVVGVLGLSVHLEALEQILGSIPLPEGSVVTLTDADSVVVARSLDAALYVGRSTEAPGRQQNPADVPASVVRTGIDGVERVFGNSLVERGPWLASVGIPTAVAVARTAPIYRRNSILAMVSTVFAFLVMLLVARQWLSAFDHLDETARRISRGDLSPLEQKRMPAAEMDHLQQTVGSMITSLRGAHESIAAQVDDERRMREAVESLQQQVVRQERLAAIGVLVSGVAHELNNPLQAILGFAELLQMQHELPESVRNDLLLIQKESARACGIIRNLALFARQQTGDAEPVRLTDVIRSVAELRQRRLESENIELRIEDGAARPVLAVLTELQQVALNFVVNAEQAVVMSGRLPGRITVRTRDEGDRVVLEVEDTGPGIAPEHEARLFQPFFTTKPVGQGTGLGLSVSYGIIDSLGGRIGHRAAPAGGAIFYFELPAVLA